MVLLPVVHMKSDRSGCLKNEYRACGVVSFGKLLGDLTLLKHTEFFKTFVHPKETISKDRKTGAVYDIIMTSNVTALGQ